MTTPDVAIVDEALDRIAQMSPEYADDLSDHAPMVVESLARLGAADAIGPYLARTLPKLRPSGRDAEPSLAAFAALAAEAADDIEAHGALSTLARWHPRFGPGLAGAAFHGALRVAHAVRSIAVTDTRARRVELARALAYASVRQQVLPRAAASGPGLSIEEALASIAPSPLALVPKDGLIATALLDRASAHPTLASIASALVLDADPVVACRSLRTAATRMFLRAEHLPVSTFTLLHAVTGMDAAVVLAGALPTPAAAAIARAAAHALLAMRVSFVGRHPSVEPAEARDSFASLVAQATASLDDHAIKLAGTLAASAGDVDEPARAAALEKWVTRLPARARA